MSMRRGRQYSLLKMGGGEAGDASVRHILRSRLYVDSMYMN